VKITVRGCRDCGRNMIPNSVYKRYKVLRATYVSYAAHGMCYGCYCNARRRGNGYEPAARKRWPKHQSGDPCRGCRRPAATRRLRSDRVVALAGYGMCCACYRWAKTHGTLPNPAPRDAPLRLAPLAVQSRIAPLDPAAMARLRAEHGIPPGGFTRKDWDTT
jgi:hypothetical protein